MPDLVADAQGRLHRSRRRFRLTVSLAAAAAVLAAASFAWSLTGTQAISRDAAAQARAAALDARQAAAQARAAALHARAAHSAARQADADADRAVRDLCGLLARVSAQPLDERAAAARLYRDFACARVPRG